MKTESKNIIIKHINKLCPQIKKPKYSSEYYLDNIVNVLSVVVYRGLL